MKKYFLAVLLILLELAACTKENNTALTDEMIKGLEKGYFVDTPLGLDEKLTMEEIEKAWGSPDKHKDNEEIQTYEFNRQGKRYLVQEDELKEVFHIAAYLDITKKEILDVMGKPDIRTGKILSYYKNDYRITFQKYSEGVWSVNLLRDPKVR